MFDKPTFIQPLQNAEELKEGEAAQLTAQVVPANDPNLRVEWYFNDAPLAKSNRTAFSHDFGMITLYISNLRATDSGIYICRAVNDNGEAVTTAGVKVECENILVLSKMLDSLMNSSVCSTEKSSAQLTAPEGIRED